MTRIDIPTAVLAAVCTLSLGMPATAFAESTVPKGPYLSSCTNAHITGFLLIATCAAKDGTSKETKLHYESCLSAIENRNGKLWCATIPM